MLASPIKEHENDWEVSFRDVQTLQRLRRQLLKADGALKASKRTACGLQSFWREFQQTMHVDERMTSRLSQEMSMYQFMVETHLEALGRLLSVCDKASRRR